VIARYSVMTALRPLDDLVRELEGVDPENPQSRIQFRGVPKELRPVAEGFSVLLGRLLDALAREKRYARNVAHELRTPLAEIRLLADVGAGGPDIDATRAAIRDIGVAASEMERVVESLLALTRYEAGLETPQPEPLELCAELRRQAHAMQASTDQHGLSVEFDLPDEMWVHADSALCRRLLANLLGNAIAHSPRQSVVKISMSPDGELRLVNPAPHLAAADLPRLGERFFRIGAGNGGSHAGLGLSLAAAIAKVLRVQLALRLRDDGCLVVSLSGFHRLEPSRAGAEETAATADSATAREQPEQA
jgi:two-component system sensor histidine kinase QseC